MKSIRVIAVESLLKVDSRAAWSNLALDGAIRKYKLNSRDSAFLAALFYGVLERGVTLDACIAAHSRSALKKLAPVVLEALRTGFYQLLYMDSVPDHAAVAESVDAVRVLGKPQATGFVNGVMRSFLRAGKAVPIPEKPLAAKLSVEYSCPEPVVGLWLESYGEEFTRRVLAGSLGRPPAYIRVNTLLTTPDELMSSLSARGIAVQRDKLLENCLLLKDTGAVRGLPEFEQGLFHVQDKASQLCAEALCAETGSRVLDVCAAPGGKSFTLAGIMGDLGEIVACDLHEKRAGLITGRAGKMGIKSLRVEVRDMTVHDPGLGFFDRILCDVPCSGLGAIRRKPEIKRKNPDDLAGLPELQYKILKTASKYCKEGARLVYSTCTLNPAENEQVVERFLNEHPEFSPAELPEILGAGSSRTILGDMDADGFYIMAMTKRGQDRV